MPTIPNPSGPTANRRRELLQQIALIGMGAALAPARMMAQSPAGTLTPLNRFPAMMQDWLMDQVVRHEPEIHEWKTRGDAERYVSEVKLRLKECFGPFPEKTPLNAKVTRILERDGYRVENLVFESRPGYLVSANLYIPANLPEGEKRPGIVGLCGHSANGKSRDLYQSYAQALARLGSVCLIIDPVGQGERMQWPNGWMKTRMEGTTGEHIQLANPLCLTGEFLGSWFAWDGIRALDYLLTRPEVDSRHLGVTGLSGGGTQTAWMMALDDRWTMAAPACFITTLRNNAENELPADSEQCPPDFLRLRLDHSDCVAAMAPKPVILLAQEKDFFDVRGTVAAYGRLKKLYTALGKPENLQLYIGPDQHTMSQPLREELYRFFHRATGRPEVGKEPVLTIEKDSDLWVAPEGDVRNLGATPLLRINAAIHAQLKEKRPAFDSPKERIDRLNKLLSLKPGDHGKVPDYRILRGRGNRQYPSKASTCYMIRTEDRIEVPCLRLTDEQGFISRPSSGIPKAVLYVSHRSMDSELRNLPWLRELAGQPDDSVFYACDLRGIGDTQPDSCGANQFDRPYGSHYFYAAHSFMLGRPLVGQRAGDLLSVISWIVSHGHREIHLVGNGWGALPATFAALNHDAVNKVTLRNALSSYECIVDDPDYRWPDAMMIPGILRWMDLPDLYAALEPKNLLITDAWGSKDGMNP
jgi:dienelactone hydrolase